MNHSDANHATTVTEFIGNTIARYESGVSVNNP